MRPLYILFILLLFIQCKDGAAQNPNMSEYDGDWEAMIHPRAFSHEVIIEILGDNMYQLSLANYKTFFNEKIMSTSKKGIDLSFAGVYEFNGRLNKEKDEISGIIKARDVIYHVSLRKASDGTYKGKWNMLYVAEFNPGILYLAVENGDGDNYEAYPIFADNRFRGTFIWDFQKVENEISFYDRTTGVNFKGELLGDEIKMDIMMGKSIVTTLQFTRSTKDWNINTTAISGEKNIKNPISKNDGLETGEFIDHGTDFSHLIRMKDSIHVEALTNVHSVLVSKGGKLIYEQYFNGFNSDIPHDTRSAAKSIGSAMVGIGIRDGLFKGVDNSIYDYLPEEYQYTKDAQKENISIEHLLTMRSGMDAIDFGTDRQGVATEDNYQQSDNWLKTVLEAPMLFEPGAHCNYGSANPFLLGVAMAEQLEVPLGEYMEENIYGPLSIKNYTMFLDDRGDPYYGGGTYMLPRDLMKFGQTYANKGKWKGTQVLPQKWVEDSFKTYGGLENTTDKSGYGYLFWHHQYEVNGKKINSVEARGAGGQLIAVIDELDMVIVITSGNYRNGRYWQTQVIVEDYVLPSFIK